MSQQNLLSVTASTSSTSTGKCRHFFDTSSVRKKALKPIHMTFTAQDWEDTPPIKRKIPVAKPKQFTRKMILPAKVNLGRSIAVRNTTAAVPGKLKKKKPVATITKKTLFKPERLFKPSPQLPTKSAKINITSPFAKRIRIQALENGRAFHQETRTPKFLSPAEELFLEDERNCQISHEECNNNVLYTQHSAIYGSEKVTKIATMLRNSQDKVLQFHQKYRRLLVSFKVLAQEMVLFEEEFHSFRDDHALAMSEVIEALGHTKTALNS